MEAYMVDALVSESGSLLIQDVPFKAGTPVEVILLERAIDRPEVERNPFWGSELKYEDPFEPISVEDWEALN